MAVLQQYSWIIALISILLCASSFGNGANDVANSYATSVAARTLTMPQVGVLSIITEFVGAVALGSRVTDTIKNDIIDLNRYVDTPAVLILVMGCVEFGNAFWLLFATRIGFPVSTTQTVVGSLIGAGIASGAQVSWSWKDGSVSQVAASWGIAPALAACFAAILFSTLKFAILERENSFEKAMRAIPFYLAFTGGVLALFIVIEAPGAGGLEELGAGAAVGIILGVFFGVLLVAYVFFMPYFHRRLVKRDSRLRPWHILLGPLLLREDAPLYFPGKGSAIVIDYYESAHDESSETVNDSHENNQKVNSETEKQKTKNDGGEPASPENNSPRDVNPAPVSLEDVERGRDVAVQEGAAVRRVKRQPEPEERFLAPNVHLPIYSVTRLWGYVKFAFLQGVTRDCVTHSSARLAAIHRKAKRYDNRVEHLWTYAQVASAMMMSIAHGSNDVANAVGPWVAAYQTYQSGEVSEETDTPIWILVIAGFLLGAGFWFMGFHIIRSLGNKITQISPTRGFSMELGAAITVLLASSLGLPVSTTQCLTGAVLGVSLMNLDFATTNWRQIVFIFCGWVLTLPSAGLIAGLLTVMALNTPQFGQG